MGQRIFFSTLHYLAVADFVLAWFPMHPAEIDILLTGSVVEHRSSALGHYAGKNLLQSKKKLKKPTLFQLKKVYMQNTLSN